MEGEHPDGIALSVGWAREGGQFVVEPVGEFRGVLSVAHGVGVHHVEQGGDLFGLHEVGVECADYGFAAVVETRATDDTVRRLRQKLDGCGVSIAAVWGYGFRLEENK